MRADFDFVFVGLGLIKVDEVADKQIQVRFGHLQLADAGKLQKCVEDLFQVSTFALNRLNLGQHSAIARRTAAFEIFAQQLKIHADGGQRISDLVGQTTG